MSNQTESKATKYPIRVIIDRTDNGKRFFCFEKLYIDEYDKTPDLPIKCNFYRPVTGGSWRTCMAITQEHFDHLIEKDQLEAFIKEMDDNNLKSCPTR